jgi:tetratricopeptide (TPR) repeat protein
LRGSSVSAITVSFFLGYVIFCSNNCIANSIASSYLNPIQTVAFKLFWSMEYDLAKQELAKAKKKSPSDPYNFFVQSFGLAVELVTEADKHKYLQYKPLEDAWLDSLRKMPHSPQRQHVMASVKLHWAMLKSAFGDGLSAAWNIRQAYILLGELNRKYPNYKPAYVYYGALNIVLSSIPDNYQWAAQLTGLVGDEAKGFQMLEKARESDPNLTLEASVALLVLKNQLEYPRKDIQKSASFIVNQYKGYDLISLLVAWIYNKGNSSVDAKFLISTLSAKNGTSLIAYTSGVAHLQTMEYTKAKSDFMKFLKESKGNALKKDTYYKLSQIAILENDSLAIMKYLEKIKKVGNDNIFVDKYALLMARYPHYTRSFLIAKLYNDGGLFMQSIASFQHVTPTNSMQKAEKYFYLARAHENLADAKQAMYYYEECAKTSPHTFYIGPLACLYVAKISLLNKDKHHALAYINKLNGYKNYDFEKSIEARGKKLFKLAK